MTDSMQKTLSFFSDPDLARGLVANIKSLSKSCEHITLMEVCGTHTVSIAKYGIKQLLPDNVSLISGPGCPVCVTDNSDIDAVIALSKLEGVIITTFGDMLRVPGSTSSLLKEKANGADVRVCYSPLDALEIAKNNPDKNVVFVGVGFETTTPIIAMTILRAKSSCVNNFSVFVAHKNMPGALELIASETEKRVDGFILPGHVSTITGVAPYQFLARDYFVPGVITGFEPVDILQGIEMLVDQIAKGEAKIDIAYSRCVEEAGNVSAQRAIDQVFDIVDSKWRGLGVIKNSGYMLKDEYSEFDAIEKFNFSVEKTVEHKGCLCGEVLQGKVTPKECPFYKTLCNPENPIGPCMVSSEGTCAAYYRYY